MSILSRLSLAGDSAPATTSQSEQSDSSCETVIVSHAPRNPYQIGYDDGERAGYGRGFVAGRADSDASFWKAILFVSVIVAVAAFAGGFGMAVGATW